MKTAQTLPSGAKWIGDRRRATKGEPPCPYLRRAFRLLAPVRRATLHWTALGVADVHLNGEKIGHDFLMPGWSDFRKRTQVMTADVTKMLRAGDNMLGAILADGWYTGTLLWKNERNHYGTHPQLLARLDVELRDGGLVTVATGRGWEMRDGPILFSDIYHGESYDARRELDDWCVPGASSKGWRRADIFPAYRGALVPKVNEPVRVTQTLRPRKITEPQLGRYVFDFGQNLSGLCRLKVRGRRGQKITLKFAEMLNADGTVYRENLRLARATDTYVCRGGRTEEWTPRFTFHGFRYVEVTGLDKKPSPELLTALVLHTDMQPTGKFRCSNPLLNRLDRNICWGLRGNFLDIPTDCPQRDERLGWTGDAQVFIGTAAFHYNIRDFFRKWLQDLRDGQRADGAYPDVAPDVLGKYGPQQFGNAAWADAGVICPWQIYRHYGDKEILAENYDAMKRWIGFQQRTSKHLIRPRTNYGDWLAIDAVTAPNAPVPCDLVGTAYFAHTTDLMAKIAGVLGENADARKFRALHGQIVEAFNNAYVTPDGRVVGHCQTAYLLALAFDLLPANLRPKAFAHLVDLVEVRGCHLTSGFIGTPLLLPVLSRFGRTDLAYKILLQEDYPSWLYTVRNGATTMWERWNSYTKEHGFGDVGMNSFNHYAYGAVGEWMYAVIGGIRAGARIQKNPLRAGTGRRTHFGRMPVRHPAGARRLPVENPRQDAAGRGHRSAADRRGITPAGTADENAFPGTSPLYGPNKNLMKIRKAFVMSVNAGAEEEYEKRHNPIWSELEEVLKDHGVSNYSIFLHPETRQLFGYAEIESEEQWASIASTEICRKWWKHMSDVMPSNPDHSPVSSPLREMFHLA